MVVKNKAGMIILIMVILFLVAIQPGIAIIPVCTITSAYWSDDIVSNGTQVTLSVTAEGGCGNESIIFDIYEDDIISDDRLCVGDNLYDSPGAIPLQLSGTAYAAETTWQALYSSRKSNCLSGTEIGSPEYFFLVKNTLGEELYQSGTLVVTGNKAPTAPMLIAPNGFEYFNNYATVNWTPSSDPDDDPLEYKIEYSTDSGVTWEPIPVVDHYGHDDAVEYNGEQKDTLMMDFG